MIDKPSDKEEEYFKHAELETTRKLRSETARGMASEEKEQLKKLHWMRCPKCGFELSAIDFRGVEVDACFACGGMFFDKGEVEKIGAEPPESGFLGNMLSSLFGSK